MDVDRCLFYILQRWKKNINAKAKKNSLIFQKHAVAKSLVIVKLSHIKKIL